MIGLYHPKDVKRSTPTQQPTIPWSSLLQQRPRQCSTLRLTPQGWGNYQELSCSLSHPHCFITSVAFYCVIAMVAFRGGSIRISSANALASPVEVRRFQWLDCTTLTRSGTHARRRPSAYACISISILYMYMYMYMHMYLYVSICIYIPIYTYTCVCVCVVRLHHPSHLNRNGRFTRRFHLHFFSQRLGQPRRHMQIPVIRQQQDLVHMWGGVG